MSFKFKPMSVAAMRTAAGITEKDVAAITKARATTRKTSRKRKVKKVSANVDLMLDGAVYIVEYDAQGKIISKAEIDAEAVLKALMYVLHQSMKKKKP
jgi:hypothetical protein